MTDCVPKEEPLIVGFWTTTRGDPGTVTDNKFCPSPIDCYASTDKIITSQSNVIGFKFKVREVTNMMFGLTSYTQSDFNPQGGPWDYVIFVSTNNQNRIFYHDKGQWINHNLGENSFVLGDEFEISLTDDRTGVNYKKNGQIFYTATQQPTFPAMVAIKNWSGGADGYAYDVKLVRT